jgi:hypothetical protein
VEKMKMIDMEILKRSNWLFVEVIFRSPARKVRTLNQFAISGFPNPGRSLEHIKTIEQLIMDAEMNETGGQGMGPFDSIDFVRASKNPKELGWKDRDKISFILYSNYISDEMTMKEVQKILNFADLPAYA